MIDSLEAAPHFPYSTFGGAAKEYADHKRRACSSKDTYHTMFQAHVARKIKQQVYKKGLWVYRCPFNNRHFHLTSMQPGK